MNGPAAPSTHNALSIVIATLTIVGTLVGVGIRIGDLSSQVSRLNSDVSEVKVVTSRTEDKVNSLALNRAGDRDDIARSKDDIEHIARRIELLEQRRK